MVIKPEYKTIRVLIEENTYCYSLIDDEGVVSVVNALYDVIIPPDPKWRKYVSLREIREGGDNKVVLNLTDDKYKEFYYDLSGKLIELPVFDEGMVEDDIVESTEVDSEYNPYGPICKKPDTIVTLNGEYVLKSCKKTKSLSIPEGYQISENPMITESTQLETDFIYIQRDNKVGVFSILDNDIILPSEYDEIQKVTYNVFLTKDENRSGLVKVDRDYRTKSVNTSIVTPNQFETIKKVKFQRQTYVITIPGDVKAYMEIIEGSGFVYLPKSMRDAYNIK